MNGEELKEKIKKAREIVGDDVQDQFAQIAFREILRVLLGQASGRVEETQGVIDSGIVVKGVNVGEFMAKLKVNTETDRMPAILFYHLHNGIESSTASEIHDVYSTIRQKKPANLSDVIGRCIRKGHIIESPEKKDNQKAWQITPSGEKYVKEALIV